MADFMSGFKKTFVIYALNTACKNTLYRILEKIKGIAANQIL